MEDDIKILKVKYLRKYWSDDTLKLIYDQTKVYVCFPRETLKEYPEEILIVAQLSPACFIVKITKGLHVMFFFNNYWVGSTKHLLDLFLLHHPFISCANISSDLD